MATTKTRKKTPRAELTAYTNTLLDMLALFNTKVPKSSPLSDSEHENIMNAVIDLYDAKQNYQQHYEDCHELINRTLSKYNYQPRIPDKPSQPNAMQHLPYEIKLLIYTMAYKAFELYDKFSNNVNNPPTQQGILDFISTPPPRKFRLYHIHVINCLTKHSRNLECLQSFSIA